MQRTGSLVTLLLAASCAAAGHVFAQSPAQQALPSRARVVWAVEPVDQTAGYRLAASASGAVFVFGHNQSLVPSRDDLFVDRLDASGALTWHVAGTAKHLRAATARGQHAFFASEVSGSADFLGVRARSSETLALVVKLDESGALTWARTHTSGSFTRVAGLAAHSDGGVAVALGVFAPAKTGALAVPLAGSSDAVVVRHAPSGEVGWVRTFGFAGYDEAPGLVAVGDDTVVAGTRWKDPSADLSARAGSCQGWVERLGPDGATIWEATLGVGAGRVLVKHVVALPASEVFVAGLASGKTRIGEVELDAGPTERGFVAKLDARGTVAWAKLDASAGCWLADTQGRLIHASPAGVRALSADGRSEARLVAFDAAWIDAVTGCALARDLYIAGSAKRGAIVAGTMIAGPITRRFQQAWQKSSETGFVARVTIEP